MIFYIDEDKTIDLENEVAELNKILNKVGSEAVIDRTSYGTALYVSEMKRNARGSGRKEVDCFPLTVENVRDMIAEYGVKETSERLGMSKQAMYVRLNKKEAAGSKYF